jgi:hypothetical protein
MPAEGCIHAEKDTAEQQQADRSREDLHDPVNVPEEWNQDD